MSLFRLSFIIVLASMLCGCFAVTASSSISQKELAKTAAFARPSETTRADVHKALGEPWISSEHWRIEVYRKTGNYRDLMVAFGLLPVPIPAPITLPKQPMTGYTLVSYSSTGIVESVDTAISKYPESPLAHMQAGDFAFTEKTPPTEGPNHTALQELTISYDRFAASVPVSDIRSCTLYVACSDTCRTNTAYVQMQLDADPSTKRHLALYPLVPLTLSPGAHTLKIFVEGEPGLGELSTTLSCAASTPLYLISTAYVRTTMPAKHLFWPSSKLSGGNQIEDHLPPELKDFGVLLWGNGQWLAER